MPEESFIDYYALLDLSPKASEEDIKKAYLDKIKDVHPDKLINSSEEKKQQALKLSKMLNQAKQILLDRKEREYYNLKYRHYMSEASARAAQQGFAGGNYNEYMAGADDILRAREMKLATEHGKYKYIIIIAIVVMGILSLIWRFTSPKDVAKLVVKEEVPVIESPVFAASLSQFPQGFALDPRSGDVLIGGEQAIVQIWSAKENKLEYKSEFQVSSPIKSLAVFGDSVFVGTSMGTVELFSLNNQERIASINAHNAEVSMLALSQNYNILASGSHDKTIKIWNLSSLERKQTLMGIAFPIVDFTFVENGKVIVFPEDRFVKMWTWSENLLRQVSFQRQKVNAVGTYGKWVAMGGRELILKQIQRQTNAVRESLPDPSVITELCYYPSGEIILSGGKDGRIRFYGTQSGRKLKVVQAHDAEIMAMAFLQGGDQLLSLGADRMMKLWKVSLDDF